MNAASMQRRCASTRPRRIQVHPIASSTPAVPFRSAFTVGRSDTVTERVRSRPAMAVALDDPGTRDERRGAEGSDDEQARGEPGLVRYAVAINQLTQR